MYIQWKLMYVRLMRFGHAKFVHQFDFQIIRLSLSVLCI